MLSSPFFRRLFLPYLLLICLATAGVGVFGGLRLREAYYDGRRAALTGQTHLLERILGERIHGRKLAELQPAVVALGKQIDARITIVAPDGVVLADSWADPATMENHATRPELVDARAKGRGESSRESHTVHDDMLYMARLLTGADGTAERGYIRLASRSRDLRSQLRLFYAALGAFAAGSMLVVGLFSYTFARRQARPILELTDMAKAISGGDLGRRAYVGGGGEVGTLADALNGMSTNIRGLLVQSEKDKAELLTILSSMAEGVVATDAAQNVVVANEAAGILLGFDARAASNKPLWQLVRNDRIIKAARDVAAGDGGQTSFELGPVHGRHLAITISPIPASEGGGGVRGLVVVAHDTTQSVRYQELRKEFVANVSHELRTPLTVIKGYVETLRDGAMGDPVKGPEYLSTIERHTNQLTNLVNDLLELSKLESQPMVMQGEVSVDLRHTTRKAVELLLPQAEKKRQAVTQDLQKVPLIAGNPDYLERAIANLIDNAVKYTPEGGTIRVGLRPHGTGVVIEVADNGLGIPKDDIPRIFERFYRVDRSRSRDMGGTGLGLSIVKHIAQAHGGSVEVSSTPGEGSTFRLRVPVRQGAVGNDE